MKLKVSVAFLLQSVLRRLGRSLAGHFSFRLKPEVHLRAIRLAASLPKPVSALWNFILNRS